MSDTDRIVLVFRIVAPPHRDIGPLLAYRVEEGGTDLPIGGTIGSWSQPFEDRIRELTERFEGRIGGPEGYEHGTEICTTTFPEGKANPDAEPDIDWHIEVDE